MPEDNIRLDADPQPLVNALNKATAAWNQYNQNIERHVQISRDVTIVTNKLTTALNKYKTAVGSGASKQREYQKATATAGRQTSKLHSRIEQLNHQQRNNIKNTTQAATTQEQASSSMDKASKSADRVNKKIQAVNISWRGMTRIVASHVIHRVLAQMAQHISEGVRQAVELQKAVAEVRTISQNAQLSTEEWFQGLVDLSSAFGTGVPQQVEAAYQTLSNQVAEGQEVIEFLAQTNEFAAASASTNAEAVQLLTGAINAYQLEASDANRVSSQFFKTIELGRVRAGEMANTFGDVAILGKQLGLSLAELQAAVSTLTIQGVKFNKASTQLRGIFIKLLKPTGKMKEFLNDIGVESGEAAIKAYGFAGIMRLLRERTRGSSSELAKYVNRIRGISGGLVFANEGLETYVENVDEITKSTKSYNNAVDEVLNNAGKRAELASRNFKNFFVEQGNTLLTFYSDLFAKSTGFYDRLEEQRERLANRTKLREEHASRIFAHEEMLRELESSLERSIAERNKARNRETESALDAYEKRRDVALRINEQIANSINDRVKKLKSEYTTSIKGIESALEDINNVAREGERQIFDWAQNSRNLAEQIEAITQRIDILQRNQTAAALTGNKKVFDTLSKEIRQLYAERYDLDQDLQEKNADALEDQKEANREIAKIRKDSSLEIARLEEEKKGKDADRKDIERQIFDIREEAQEKIDEQRTKLKEAITLDRARVGHAEAYNANIEREIALREALAKIQEAQAKKQKARLVEQELLQSEIKSLLKEFKEFELGKTLRETDIETLKASVAERQQVIEQLMKRGAEVGVDVSKFANIRGAVQDELGLLTDRIKLLEDNRARRKDLNTQIDASTEAFKQQSKILKEMGGQTLETISEKVIKYAERMQSTTLRTHKSLKDLEKLDLGNLEDISDPKALAQQIRGVTRQLNSDLEKYRDLAHYGGLQASPTYTAGADLGTQLVILRNMLLEYDEEKAKLGDIGAKKQELKEQTDRIKKALEAGNKEIEKQGAAIDKTDVKTKTLIETNKDLLRVYRDQTEALRQQTGGTDEPEAQAFGSVMRGRDSKMALRQPGEAVINAANTRKFYSQLAAINGAPQNVVTQPNTTNVGDVNVTMQATNPSYDAAQLGKEIKRAARRGLV